MFGHDCDIYRPFGATVGTRFTCMCGVTHECVRRWPWRKWKSLGRVTQGRPVVPHRSGGTDYDSQYMKPFPVRPTPSYVPPSQDSDFVTGMMVGSLLQDALASDNSVRNGFDGGGGVFSGAGASGDWSDSSSSSDCSSSDSGSCGGGSD